MALSMIEKRSASAPEILSRWWRNGLNWVLQLMPAYETFWHQAYGSPVNAWKTTILGSRPSQILGTIVCYIVFIGSLQYPTSLGPTLLKTARRKQWLAFGGRCDAATLWNKRVVIMVNEWRQHPSNSKDTSTRRTRYRGSRYVGIHAQHFTWHTVYRSFTVITFDIKDALTRWTRYRGSCYAWRCNWRWCWYKTIGLMVASPSLHLISWTPLAWGCN